MLQISVIQVEKSCELINCCLSIEWIANCLISCIFYFNNASLSSKSTFSQRCDVFLFQCYEWGLWLIWRTTDAGYLWLSWSSWLILTSFSRWCISELGARGCLHSFHNCSKLHFRQFHCCGRGNASQLRLSGYQLDNPHERNCALNTQCTFLNDHLPKVKPTLSPTSDFFHKAKSFSFFFSFSSNCIKHFLLKL